MHGHRKGARPPVDSQQAVNTIDVNISNEKEEVTNENASQGNTFVDTYSVDTRSTVDNVEELSPRLFVETASFSIRIPKYYKMLYSRRIARDKRLRRAFKLAVMALIQAFAEGRTARLTDADGGPIIMNLNINVNEPRVVVVPEYVVRFIEKIARGGGGALQQPPRWARDEARRILDKLRKEGLVN